MLGWMLKRGEHAQDAEDGDTTQLDQPDTPAPVFAARAFKSALFGTPAPSHGDGRKRGKKPAKRASKLGDGSGTPTKPPGILLTPGTGTSRRKRVSFDYETKSDASKAAAIDDKPCTKRDAESVKIPQNSTNARPTKTSEALADDSEGEWEEEDDENDDHCTHDITIDLNEPHSQSGRYWKEEFQKYHQEAKAEMEKLLKYKQLAKSYARQKDAEAIQLAEKLRDEQQKVIDMEKKISENATQIVSKSRHSDKDSSDLLAKLAKQTTLAAQYRHRVQELEDELDQLMHQKEGRADDRKRRSNTTASPNTQKTLMETQRELRRARNQLKEVESLRKEVSTLKARAKVAEALANNHERADADSAAESTIQRLRTQLERSRKENAEKTEELRRLKSDFEAFRKDSEVHEADTKAVLERAHAKISDLKKEVRTLKAANTSQPQPEARRSQTDANRVSSQDDGRADAPVRRDVVREDTISDDEGWRPSRNGIGAMGAPSATQSRRTKDEPNDAAKTALGALAERTNLGKPKWQPFVPRSPRNRAYLGEDTSRRVRGVGATCSVTHPKDISAPVLPDVAVAAARMGESEATGDESEVDLLQGRFARMGGPDTHRSNKINSSMLGNTSKNSTLPPDRRAVALARIEARMAEKKRASSRRSGYDKENLRP
ncbi:hypothetical protein HIM_08740 [Hirsutella minnesotensis 3608]|uniref:Spindle pole body-associated protein cut12 domain-containing protein n=1 Tax=Hirsutella minnesotensis 3608 TaxID=1043627 RepID=A0A0F7ZMB7_9HYPO|nr:hypothetical protein HIM_08740 [Hirsutella minnesotensis 3608]